MAYSLITDIGAGSVGGGDVTTAGVNTSGGTLLVAALSFLNGETIVVIDSKTNTWTHRAATGGGSPSVKPAYVDSATPTVGSSHTFTADCAGTAFPSIIAAAFSGSAATPLDQQSSAEAVSGTSASAGSITPSEDNCLVVAILGYSGSDIDNCAIDSGFAIIRNVPGVGGNCFGQVMAYKIQTTAAAVNPTWSWTTSRNGTAYILSFKAGAAGATGFGQPFGGRRNNPVAMMG